MRSIVAVLAAALLLAGVATADDAAAPSDVAAGAAAAGKKKAPLTGACAPTPFQPVPGPLYKPGSPRKRVICERFDSAGLVPVYQYISNATAQAQCSGTFCWGARSVGKATRLVVRGRVTDTHCQPIAGAEVDVYQPDSRGVYASVHPGEDDGACRGVVTTDADGYYAFETYAPGHYGLLSGALSTDSWPIDLPPWVPRHIHVIAWAKGFHPLVTQLYFAGDPVREFDFRAHLAGQSLGALEDGLRLTPTPCTIEQRRAYASAFGELPAGCECADAPLTLRPATAAPYSTFATLHDATVQSVCVDAEFTPGTPLPLCKPAVEPLLRPLFLIPCFLTALVTAVALPVALVVALLRAVGLCKSKRKFKTQ